MKRRIALPVLAGILLAATACAPAADRVAAPARSTTATAAASDAPSTAAAKPWRSVDPPTGAPSGSEWIAVETFDGRSIVTAVARPAGRQAAPVAIVLHDDGGARPHFLGMATWLAEAGFIAMTPCWQGLFIAPDPESLGCSTDAPQRDSARAVSKDIMAVAAAARTLEGARQDRLVLIGFSRGATAAILTASLGAKVDAVVAVAGAYGTRLVKQRWGTSAPDEVAGLAAPLLMVHGTNDQAGPGTSIDTVRAYERAARELGKAVETHYLDGAPHELYWSSTYWTPELRASVLGFLAPSRP